MVRRYRNSPIIEALCEVQFEPNSPWDMTMPGLIFEALRDGFPVKRQTKVLGGGIGPGPEEAIVQQQVWATDRMQFVREDGTALVQVGAHFLAVNHLRPYSSWPEFLPMIQRAVEAYRAVAEPGGIHRVGLRYINRIEFPASTIDLADHLTFYPHVGPHLPQDYTTFIAGIQTPYEDGRDVLSLQAAGVGAEAPGTIAMTLDIDYFLAVPGAVTLDALFGWIDAAHGRIETTFEAAITDRLREMFGEVRE